MGKGWGGGGTSWRGIVTTFHSISSCLDTLGVAVGCMAGSIRIEMMLKTGFEPSGAKNSGHRTGSSGHDWARLHSTAFPCPEGIWHGSYEQGTKHRARDLSEVGNGASGTWE